MAAIHDSTAPNPPVIRQFRYANVIGLYSLFRREAKREIRWFGVAFIGPAIQAALFALVFSLAADDRGLAVDGLNFLEFLAAGLVISSIMQRGFETTGYSIMFDKLECDGLQDIMGAPLSPAEILTAYLAAAVAMALSIGVVIWLVMVPFGLGLPEHPLAVLFFAAISAAIFSLLGLIGAIFSRKWDSLAGKETFFMAPTIFLSGTFFPLSAVPEGPWRAVFQGNPLYYLVDGFRWAATGRLETDPWFSAFIALVLFIVTLAIASRLLATGYKLKP